MKDSFKRMFRNVNPAIVIIILILLVNKMLNSNQSIGDWLYTQLLLLPGIIIGLTFHEAAHGYVSHWLGDPTPGLQGRLSLNPMRHIDPVGFLALFFAGFGWGQPVQIDPRYYKHRRRDELLVALAGVIANFIIAFAASLGLKLMMNTMGTAVLYGRRRGSVLYLVLCDDGEYNADDIQSDPGTAAGRIRHNNSDIRSSKIQLVSYCLS